MKRLWLDSLLNVRARPARLSVVEVTILKCNGECECLDRATISDMKERPSVLLRSEILHKVKIYCALVTIIVGCHPSLDGVIGVEG